MFSGNTQNSLMKLHLGVPADFIPILPGWILLGDLSSSPRWYPLAGFISLPWNSSPIPNLEAKPYLECQHKETCWVAKRTTVLYSAAYCFWTPKFNSDYCLKKYYKPTILTGELAELTICWANLRGTGIACEIMSPVSQDPNVFLWMLSAILLSSGFFTRMKSATCGMNFASKIIYLVLPLYGWSGYSECWCLYNSNKKE